MNNIYTIAAGLTNKQKSKKVCFDIVKDMICGELKLTEKELATLYAYFMPNIPAKPKTVEQWVSKVIDKTEVRYNLHHLYVVDGRLVATDGHHRIHSCSTTLENGYHDCQLQPIKIDARFPVLESIFYRKNEFEIDHTEKLASVTSNNTHVFLIGEQKISIDQKFYNDALSNPSNLISVRWDGVRSSYIRFIFEDWSEAIISPTGK